MYSVRLLVRSFARESPYLNCRLAHSWKETPKSKPKEWKNARFGNYSDQLAGLRRQSKTMGYTPDEMKEFEELDDEEMNLSMAEQIYDVGMAEMKWKESKHTLAEYGQKYYKPKKEPSLLSWDDMEQIRRLHTEEKWPISDLSRSFPANEFIIEKVCKSKRNPSLAEQFKHDEKVAQNWVLLRKGKLEISEKLRLHCLRFTNRVARPMTSKDIAIINMKPSRPPGSFLNIINPPEEKKEDENNEESDPDPPHTTQSDHILQHLRSKITLEEARKRELDHIADRETVVDDDDKLFLYGSGPSEDVSSQETERKEYIYPGTPIRQSLATKSKSTEFVSKWDSSGRSVKARREALMAPLDDYPEKIIIPDVAKKPGAIYRVEDCFYDENGEFIYRVPGLKL